MDTKTILMLTIVMITLTGTAIASDWQQFQKNEVNNGLTDSPAPTEYPELAWSRFTHTSECGNGIDVTPIIAGDKIYVFAANGSIWAFNKTNGDLIWENETTGGTLQTSTPAYGDGKIFVAAKSGDLFAFDAETGEELWNVHVIDRNFECPITYFDHRIYLGEGLTGGVTTKYYYCYSDAGTEIWSHAISNTAGFLWCGASVVGDYIVFATHEGELISVYRDDGMLADKIDLTSDLSFSKSDLGMVRASVAYHDGYVYTTSEQGQSIGYIWKVGFDDSSGTFNDCGWSTANGFSTSTPVIYDGRVYVGQGEHGCSGNLTCLDDSTGAILWSYPVDAGVKSSPAVSVQGENPYIYFTGAKNDGLLYCLKGDGTLAWKYNPPDDGYILQGGAISDGNVYFGTGAGYLYCIAGMETPPPLTAFFTAEPRSGTAPLNVAFTDESSGYDVTEWEWDFGDGDNSTEQNPSHIYAEGTYSVSLTVTNATGSDTCNRTNYITVSSSSAPVANFGASITSGYEPLIVSFEDLSLNNPDSWDWDFGDGGVSTRQNPKHAYITPGTYNVSLTVANTDGSDTKTAANYITCIEWVVPGWVTGDGWEQFHNDARHAGFSSSTVPDTNNILWVSDDIGAVSSSSPVVTGGRLFVNCGDTVVSLDESTGAYLSVHGEGSSAYGSWASPCYHDGNVWCGLNEHPEDAPYSSVNGGTMVADWKVYVGNWDGGQYFCLDVADGGELWNFTVEGADPGAIGGGCAQGTPAYSDGKVYLTSWLYGADAGNVYCLDADTGALVWHQNNIPGQCCGSPAIADGIVYVTTYNFYDDGEILALDANDGSILWRQTIERTDGTPAVAYGNVYVCGGCYEVSDLVTYCFNATTGDLVWNTTASEGGIGGWTVSVAVADGMVFVGNSSGYSGCAGTYALDAATGVVIWSSPDGGSSPAVADGIVFTIGGDGRVYAFGEPLKPDLVSISLVPGMLYSNQQSTITATIANDGAASASAFNVSLEYEGTTIGITTIDSLDAGVEATTEFLWTPASTGTFGLTVTTDLENTIDESNETNNNLTRAILVKESIDWQQFHRDVGHSGFSQSDAPDTNYTAWISDEIGAQTGSSTVIAEGKVFVYCNDHLVCLNERTGAVLWNISIESTPDVCCSWTTPAYHDGNVFLSANKTYCFDATDGGEVWSFAAPTGKGTVNGGCAIADGKVFTSDWDGGYYYCLDVADGSVIWDFAVGGKAQSTPAVSVADGYVFFGSYTGICEDGGVAYCVDMATGTEIWNITTDNSFCGSVAIGDGIVYLTEYNFDGNGALYALDAATGNVIWSQPVQRTDSTPALAYGNVYISGGVEGMTDLVTYCFNASNGNLLWSTSASDEIGSWKCSVAVADGKVFSGKPYFSFPVMDFVGTYALDSATGDVIWSCPAGGSSPAVADGMVFTIGSGRMYAFRDLIRGDTNNDGTITTADAVIALRIAVGSVAPNEEADVNRDGSVTSLDALMIMQAAAGHIEI
ncbi:MAG: PQQ-binding-like beta-propeller repeat protein [Methanosarcinales archaeon]|nr:PQQ-binding-like beta-propeller repeat protein [Methanosarcinales archaeon]